MIISVFEDAPPTAPSLAQLKIQENITKESKSFMQNLTILVKNRSYVLLFFTYGINAGMYYALNILLSQIILSHYPVSGCNILQLIESRIYYFRIGCLPGCWNNRLGYDTSRNFWICIVRSCFG